MGRARGCPLEPGTIRSIAANLGDSFVFDTIGTPGLWAAFAAFVVAALAISVMASLAIAPRSRKNA